VDCTWKRGIYGYTCAKPKESISTMPKLQTCMYPYDIIARPKRERHQERESKQEDYSLL
jgi:hypothetical protein